MPRMTGCRAAVFVMCALPPFVARAQAPAWDARITHTTAAIRLDGMLAEVVWLTADSVTAFMQSDPAEGRAGTERTVVRLLATPEGLYVGVWAYDSQPSAIRHTQLRRDADFGPDDSFTLLLDPLRDRRTGFLFEVNPNGAMADAQVINYETINPDWNGVWDARARLTSFGWTAELFIPWQTLRYLPGNDIWGVNFERLIRRKNEDVLWRGWRRTEGILFLPHEGLVAGFTGLPRRTLAELRPYSAATAQARELQYPPDGPDSVLNLGTTGLKVGLDAKLAPAPTLTLDLTANTDFAQVEADSQVINLSRFPILFPEKRPFFLESSGTFSFGQFGSELFYSRRIGLDTLGTPIPLDAGVRLTGRLGPDQIGLLAVRTGGLERAVDLVARVKHDVFSRGYVGAIVTNQTAPGVRGDRLAGGADFSFPLYVRDQNLVFAAWGAGSRAGAGTAVASAWRLSIDFPNDFMDNFVSLGRVEPNFSPPLGFVSETDILRTSGHFDVYPRPHALGVRRLQFRDLRERRPVHRQCEAPGGRAVDAVRDLPRAHHSRGGLLLQPRRAGRLELTWPAGEHGPHGKHRGLLHGDGNRGRRHLDGPNGSARHHPSGVRSAGGAARGRPLYRSHCSAPSRSRRDAALRHRVLRAVGQRVGSADHERSAALDPQRGQRRLSGLEQRLADRPGRGNAVGSASTRGVDREARVLLPGLG